MDVYERMAKMRAAKAAKKKPDGEKRARDRKAAFDARNHLRKQHGWPLLKES